MQTDAQIRPARPEDIPTLIDMRERMLVELGSEDASRLTSLRDASRPWFEHAFAEGRAVGWIAEREGATIGGVTMTLSEGLPQYRSPSGRVASVLGLYVVPEARGAGLATELVREAIASARAWGADLVMLHAADKARPIYERLGFVRTKEMRLQFSEVDGLPPTGGCGV